jgi:uncharacterized protein
VRGLFDINLLIALLDGGHTLHERAHAWWSANLSAGWASCPLTENGLIRIMSNPTYRSKIPLKPSFLAAQLALFAVETNHEFWPDSLSFRDDRYFGLDQMQTGRSLTDIYLLGLAASRGGRLVTFDRNIPLNIVPSARPAHLCVIP